MNRRTTVMCLASRLDETALVRYGRLRLPPGTDKLICLDTTAPSAGPAPAGVTVEGFSFHDIRSRGYRPIVDALVPGSNHFPIVERAAAGGGEFTWCVEYDVDFSGQWDAFFAAHEASDADLLAAFLTTRADDPGWYWWDSLRDPSGAPPGFGADRTVRSFNPVYRISRRAARFLRSLYLAGWQGHHEVSMATLLVAGGYRVEDFGGHGRFVRPHNRGRWYRDETYRHRTPIARPAVAGPDDLLYHPVKSAAGGSTQG